MALSPDGDIITMMYTGFIVVAFLPLVAMAQNEPAERPKVVTVCEILGNPNLYRDSVVAVVGRLERSISLTDHYEHLAEDRCEKPVVTKGYVWSTRHAGRSPSYRW